MRNLTLMALLMATSSAAYAVTPNLIVNGGFEANTSVQVNGFSTFDSISQGLVGWTIGTQGGPARSVDVVGKDYWSAAAGNYSLDLDGSSRGAISQSFTTSAGQQYKLSFDLAGNPQGGVAIKALQLNVGGIPAIYFDTTGKTTSNMGWVNEVFVFTAGTATTTLTFASLTAGAFGVALDNISVTAVPEPESYAMLLAGLGLMGTIARRRSKSKAV